MNLRQAVGRITFAVLTIWATQAIATPRPTLAEPSLSPDGAEIVFVSGGDIWAAPASGGTASLLITDPATEGRPLFSPDGRELAFTSTRNGVANIYVMALATGQIRRLTVSDAAERLDGWSRDGKWIYLSTGANDIALQNDIFRVASAGGTPLEVSRERFLNEFHAAPSPDGLTIALMAKGRSSGDWWRNGHAHIDEAELWLKPISETGPYRRLLEASSKRLWPMWSADGTALYFMSDEGGTENIWRTELALGARPQAVTGFTEGRVLFPSIAYDGRAIVFEREFEIWKLDTATGSVARVPIALRGAPASAGERRVSETSFESMALSPDGKKLALIARGEVFAASTRDAGTAQRITETPGAETSPTWSPDSRRLAYVSERGLTRQVMEYDFVTQTERTLTDASGDVWSPVYAPDGKSLAYVSGQDELRVVPTAGTGSSGSGTLIFKGALGRQNGVRPTWSPDSRWLAFMVTDRRAFRNVWVAPAAGGEARAVSFLGNGTTSDTIAWSPNGKYLLFDTTQRNEDSRIVRVDLLPNTPKYREDAFQELFRATPVVPASRRAETPTTPSPTTAALVPTENPAFGTTRNEPVRIAFDGIRERTTVIPLGVSADTPVISPDGKTLVYTANRNLFAYDLDDLAGDTATPEQLAGGRRSKSDYAFDPGSKQLYFLDGGRVSVTALESPRPRTLEINGEMIVRFDAERQVVFDQAWSIFNRSFYDPTFHGRDWAALRSRFEPFALGARTPDELRRVINLMLGELDASHVGVSRPIEGFGSVPSPRIGDLGLRFDRSAQDAGQGLVVREVIALGPADIEGAIKPGDTLLAVEGRSLGSKINLNSLLLDRIGKRTALTMATAGGGRRVAFVRPVSASTASGLLYRQWVRDRRTYVENASSGRLGYVHILDVGTSSLSQLAIDLDAQNQGREGVVVDLRNNFGGFLNGQMLDVFNRKNFLTMTPRSLFGVPGRQNLGQRALSLPTVLVTNESTLSDAENFTEGYRALGLGKIVGVPTAGWLIYTSQTSLIDGSVFRMPYIRVDGADGKNMERNPRPVDLTVERQLGETLAGKDAQLDAAVAELLKGLGTRR